MLREKAEMYADAIQKAMGDEWTTYRAIRSHKHQTWIVMCFFKYENINMDYEYTTEEELITMLVRHIKNQKNN